MAIPAILQQLNRSSLSQAAQPVRQMMAAVRTAQNPQAMLNQLIMNNPQLKQVMDIVRQYGGDPMTAFKTLAEEKGINPDDVLNMLK